MAEGNSPPSPKKVSGRVQRKFRDTGPDMDVMEWVKKHIDLPERRAAAAKLRVPSKPAKPQKCERLLSHMTGPVLTVEARKKITRGLLAKRANQDMIERMERERELLWVERDGLWFRCSDITSGRRSR